MPNPRRVTVRLLLGIGLVVSLAGGPAGAIPPVAGGALASSNVELLATLPDVAAGGARILGSTMYVTTAQGIRIYDISNTIPALVGALELPAYVNEDVDTNAKILLVASDYVVNYPRFLFVIDVSNPRLPVLRGSVLIPRNAHTATCINECTYAWLGGGRFVQVVDLTEPANPRVVGQFTQGGTVHDVNVDAQGVAWVVSGFGAGGVVGYDTTDPVQPRAVASALRDDPGAFDDDYILHNSMRPRAVEVDGDDAVEDGEVLLVTEEDWVATSNDWCAEDGEFQTGWYRLVDGRPVVERLDGFSLDDGTLTQGEKPDFTMATCSAHYFDERDGIVAIAWYEQGVRFLDVSNPRDIRQVGYFMPLVTEALHALFHGDVVYTFDTVRGIDVLRFTGSAGAPEVLAPRYNTTPPVSAPDPVWGYACRIPIAA